MDKQQCCQQSNPTDKAQPSCCQKSGVSKEEVKEQSQCCKPAEQKTCNKDASLLGETQIKQQVVKDYGKFATNQKDTSCCLAGGALKELIDQQVFAEDYSELQGYNPDADLNLGCGKPTQFAPIKQGDIVVDLGSGAGNDCFVARALCGEKGKVIGIDLTPQMIRQAQMNSDKKNYNNVEFRHGDLEDLPILNDYADVVISNCVINLVPDKKKAFSEIYRILKSGGLFTISDILLEGELESELKLASDLYSGCIAGAMQKQDQIDLIKEVGFKDFQIRKEKVIQIPFDKLVDVLQEDVLLKLKNSKVRVLSCTMVAYK